MKKQVNPMPKVTFDGKTYSLTSRKTEIPDFTTMSRVDVLVFLLGYTRPTYGKVFKLKKPTKN